MYAIELYTHMDVKAGDFYSPPLSHFRPAPYFLFTLTFCNDLLGWFICSRKIQQFLATIRGIFYGICVARVRFTKAMGKMLTAEKK